jgi:hypothetical protein
MVLDRLLSLKVTSAEEDSDLGVMGMGWNFISSVRWHVGFSSLIRSSLHQTRYSQLHKFTRRGKGDVFLQIILSISAEG